MPRVKKSKTVFVQFSANEQGNIDRVSIIKGSRNVFNQEAARVVKAIPEWDVYYRRGEFEKRIWTIPVIFSRENRVLATKN